MNEAELERFESQAAQIVSAAKGLLTEFEARLAQAVNDQRVTNAQAREEAARLQAILKDVSTQTKALTATTRKDLGDIRNEWRQPFEDAARESGRAQAQAFGQSISAGLRSQLEDVTERARWALNRYHWASIATWAIGVGIAIPLTVALGVWALLPSVDGVDPLRVRVAMSKLEPCEFRGKPRLCIAVDDKPELWKGASGEPVTAVRGL